MRFDDRARRCGHEQPLWPESLAIPVRRGGRVTSVYESASFAMASLVYPLDEYDALVRFYDDALDGWTCSRTDLEGSRSSEYSRGSSTVVVNLCVDTESEGFEIDAACVAITQVT